MIMPNKITPIITSNVDRFWEKYNFVHFSKLFPELNNNDKLLVDFVNNISDLKVLWDIKTQKIIFSRNNFLHPSEILVDLGIYPKLSIQTTDKINSIYQECFIDYIPRNVKDLQGSKYIKDQTEYLVLNLFRQYEQRIVSEGGRSFRQELAYRFGIMNYDDQVGYLSDLKQK